MSEFTATSPEILSSVCALITLKPNQPTESTHAPSARKGIDDGGCALTRAGTVVAPAPRSDDQHGGKADPAADRVHDHAPGEIVELCTEARP